MLDKVNNLTRILSPDIVVENSCKEVPSLYVCEMCDCHSKNQPFEINLSGVRVSQQLSMQIMYMDSDNWPGDTVIVCQYVYN